ncbi:MAG TPA: sigma-70 family RNA polymerase sigma factor, partial [Planctomycetia bacterium]|nr:sigma-70 family RNA polymerase sigma factor [Planctomycetia bacterium]
MNPISAMVSDGALIAAARAGSGDAFCQLVERHQSLACAVAYSHCGRQAPSEDLAQEAFLAAWRDLASLREPDRFRGWLAGIVRNLARAWNRRAAARPSGGDLDPDLLPSAEPDPEATVSEREEEELVWKALASMPETYREPLVLFHREGEAVAAVAAKLELSEDAVKQRLSRGRALLKERVSDLVERSLRRTRPSATFTLRVLAAWSSMMALAGSATAGPATLAAGFGAKGAAGAAAGATAWGA